MRTSTTPVRNALAAVTMVVAVSAAACSETAGDPSGSGSAPAETPAVEAAPPPEAPAADAPSPPADPPPRDQATDAVPSPPPVPTAPNGQHVPALPTDPRALSEALVEAERLIRDPETSSERLAEAGRVQQLAYRRLAVDPTLDEIVLAGVPDELRRAVELNLAARREFVHMPTGLPTATDVPAWRIIEPEPADQLLAHYLEAQTASGVGWEYLAAINLVETAMGRIQGLSTASARGPMQFIEPTWDWIGEGDVDDPRDSILAAGRLLAFGGGPGDMGRALWGYNQSEHYVRAVQTYAEIMRADPRAYLGYYHWEVYFFTTSGDVWLPVGYHQEVPVPVEEYLAQAPWSEVVR